MSGPARSRRSAPYTPPMADHVPVQSHDGVRARNATATAEPRSAS